MDIPLAPGGVLTGAVVEGTAAEGPFGVTEGVRVLGLGSEVGAAIAAVAGAFVAVGESGGITIGVIPVTETDGCWIGGGVPEFSRPSTPHVVAQAARRNDKRTRDLMASPACL